MLAYWAPPRDPDPAASLSRGPSAPIGRVRALPWIHAMLHAVLHAVLPVLLLAAVAGAQVRPADPDTLAALGSARASVQTLALPAAAGDVTLVPVVIDGEPVVLELFPSSVRAPGFRLLVQDETGALSEVEAPPPATVRGLVQGRPGSAVSGSLLDGALTAIVMLGAGDEAWAIQPLADVDSAAAPGEHLVFDSVDDLDLGFTCGAVARGDGAAAGPVPGGAPEGAADGGFAITLIAADADFEYYQANNSNVIQTTNDIENVIGNVATIYEFTAGITYQVGTVIVRTVANDPYDTTSSSGILNEFRDEWNANQTGVTRNVAHMFTGKDMNGSVIGIAWLDVNFCASPFSNPLSYGVSQSKFSANAASRTGLTAHELGHNWDCSHCDGIAGCKIMCSGIGGCEGLGAFGPTSTNSIWNKLGNTPCLNLPGGPSLASAAPAAIDAFYTGQITVTGTNLFGIEELVVDDGTGPVATSFTSSSATAFSFTPPEVTQLGDVTVQIETFQGTSNSISYAMTGSTPPKLIAPPLMATENPFDFTWLGEPGATAYLLVGAANATLPFKGSALLWPNFTLFVQTLDPLGLGGITVSPPPAAAGITVFSQILTLQAGEVLGTSDVDSSWIIF